jgi:hypothetical protein
MSAILAHPFITIAVIVLVGVALWVASAVLDDIAVGPDISDVVGGDQNGTAG